MDFAVRRYCKALCDINFRQKEGNGRKFRHTELSNHSSVKFITVYHSLRRAFWCVRLWPKNRFWIFVKITHTHILVTLTSTHQKPPDHFAVQQGGKLEHWKCKQNIKVWPNITYRTAAARVPCVCVCGVRSRGKKPGQTETWSQFSI